MINFICLCVFHIFANFSQNFRIHGLWSQRDNSSLFLLQCSVYFAADGRETPNTYHVLLSYIVSNLIKRLEFNLILNRERYFVCLHVHDYPPCARITSREAHLFLTAGAWQRLPALFGNPLLLCARHVPATLSHAQHWRAPFH